MAGLAGATREELWAEECCRHDGYAVTPPVGVRARRDDDGVQQVIADPGCQPGEVAHVSVADRAGELHLEGYHPAVAAFYDQVDLMVATSSAEMADSRLSCLRVHADIEGHERLEERTQQGAVAGEPLSSGGRIEEGAGIDSKQPCRESGIGELVLRRRRQARDSVARRQPGRYRVDDPETFENVPVGAGRRLRWLP